MNRIVAYKLLADEIAAYCRLPTGDIRQLAGEHSTRLVRGEDGVAYSLTVVMPSHSDGDSRVVGFIGIADSGSAQDVRDDEFSE
jgi:hypothetical protein